MAVAPTYPGVYIQEVPSGVRTVVGVSTSVTAFVGVAKRGPVNKAVRIFGFAEFERRFGGLSSESELSYAVRQFFLNGGAEALIVRVAKDAQSASRILVSDSGDSLRLVARDQGKSGENVQVRVDHQTAIAHSTFNLTLLYESADNPGDNSVETFANLSMNPGDPRYVLDVVNEGSRLVTVEREAGAATGSGTSRSGAFPSTTDFPALLDGAHRLLYVSIDGEAPVTIPLDEGDPFADLDDVAELAAAITAGIAAAGVDARLTCTDDTDRLVLTSTRTGDASSVRVLPGGLQDASARLRLGTSNGGEEADAAAENRPQESPRGTLTSGTVSAGSLPSASQNKFRLALDGNPPVNVPLGDTAAATLDDLAVLIQRTVRELRPLHPSFKNFTCTVASSKLVLTSGGVPGAGSEVRVEAAPDHDIAAALHLLPSEATSAPGSNARLEGGLESEFGEEDALAVYIGDRAGREGLFALEGVPLFNLLCLPGVTNPSILSDAVAYCQERRAFLIADCPRGRRPEEMLDTATGTALPKSDHAAVYYPWLEIADPLRGGKRRACPPSGTIAGLHARTDSSRGVWKAPAGTEATLLGVLELEHLLTDGENGTLNPVGVNCLRIFPVFGAICWGARTLRGADQMASEYKYVPVRRLALFIEQSLYLGTQWAVFEPNDEPLWSQLRLAIGAFMQNLFRQGAFQGKTPNEAYFVKCDKETTTQNDINLGIVNIVVGFAPLKPAEFVIVKLQQIAGQIQV